MIGVTPFVVSEVQVTSLGTIPRYPVPKVVVNDFFLAKQYATPLESVTTPDDPSRLTKSEGSSKPSFSAPLGRFIVTLNQKNNKGANNR